LQGSRFIVLGLAEAVSVGVVAMAMAK